MILNARPKITREIQINQFHDFFLIFSIKIKILPSENLQKMENIQKQIPLN